MARVKSIAHVAIASRALADGVKVFVDALGLADDGREHLADRQLDVAFIRAGDVHLELLESLAPDTPIGTFIDKNGPGLHHICFDVEGLDEMVARCEACGLELIGGAVTAGAQGKRVAFLHPKTTGGVLIELSEDAAADAAGAEDPPTNPLMEND
jgi:methylmalonyl-CoA/ethylmalonyl-CoA epimerase